MEKYFTSYKQGQKQPLEVFCEKRCSSKLAIYKTRNTGTGNGMRRMRGTRGMFTGIPGNPLEDSGECYYFIIPGNVEEDSGECSKRFRRMFKKIPGNVPEDSEECSNRFRGMFEKIPGNVQEDSGECSRGFRGMFEKIPGNVQEESRVNSHVFALSA